MKPVQVVGLGLDPKDLSPRLRGIIDEARVLAGGRRLLDFFPGHPGRRLVLAGGLEDWLGQVEQEAGEGSVVVLASGDPGFFGIARRLVERLGRERVEIHPNLSCLQVAFARLGLAWDQAAVLSLHGRGLDSLAGALRGRDLVAVLTDPQNHPGAMARLLLERGQAEHWRMWVLEDLGGREERVRALEPAQAVDQEFYPLNLVVFQRRVPAPALCLGAEDESYQHQAGLITKAEVRAVALAKLALGPGLTLWDLGAGCGSVGLEACLLMPGGRVLAVEQDEQRVEQIKANRRRCQAAELEVIQGRLPGALAGLARPDRVFVGGGGDQLAAIIEQSLQRLGPGGVLVAAVVRLESLEAARAALVRAGLEPELVQVQVSRGRSLGGGVYLKALNPVWLVRGIKGGKGGEA